MRVSVEIVWNKDHTKTGSSLRYGLDGGSISIMKIILPFQRAQAGHTSIQHLIKWVDRVVFPWEAVVMG